MYPLEDSFGNKAAQFSIMMQLMMQFGVNFSRSTSAVGGMAKTSV